MVYIFFYERYESYSDNLSDRNVLYITYTSYTVHYV